MPCRAHGVPQPSDTLLAETALVLCNPCRQSAVAKLTLLQGGVKGAVLLLGLRQRSLCGLLTC